MLSCCSGTVSVLSQTIVVVSWLSPWLDGTTWLLPSASPAPSPWTDRRCGICSVQFSSVQSLTCVQLFATPWITARQTSLSITNSRSFLKLMPIESWCHPAISSSVVPFSSCPQSLPTSGSFPMSQLFLWGGQSIGVSASAYVSVYISMPLSPFVPPPPYSPLGP